MLARRLLRSSSMISLINPFFGAALLLLITHSLFGSVGAQLSTGWTSSTGTITPYTPPPPLTTAGTYWSSTWLVEDWPRPIAVNGIVIAPVASLSLSVQEQAPAARHVAASTGEFFLLGQDGQVHAAPAQRPDQWHPLQAAVAAPGTEDFSLNDGVQLLTQYGFVSFDPGPAALTPLADEPALDPAAHPVRFAPFSRIFVRPGTTYSFLGYGVGSEITGFHGRPNSGLTLPALYGDAVDAPRRAHSLRKIVQTGYTLFGLGELHPQTPGFALGTQVLFKSLDSGITWVFQPLPAGGGRWHDLAVNHTVEAWPYAAEANPVGTQIVIVGDDGIYTSRNDGQTWLHIRENITVATASPLPLVQPARTDAPVDEAITLRLNSVVWAKDHFIAAGRTLDGAGRPVFVEGLSKYWFAYPLDGWPETRTVDEIASHQDRRLFLSKTGGTASLLAANVPVFAAESQGDAPVLFTTTPLHPILGTYAGHRPILIHSPSVTVRRYLIESSDGTTWGAFLGTLYPPSSRQLDTSVFLQDEPTHLTITAINEFGRSSPLEVDVDPVLPPLLQANYAAPVLSLPRMVTAPFGSRINIPVKQLNKVPWPSDKTWFYGLPPGLSFDASQTAIVGHALVPGTHTVSVLTILKINGSTSWAGPLTINIPAPAAQAGDVGSFAGTLDGDSALAGTWTVTLRRDRSFTGQIRMAKHTYSIRGNLSAEPGVPNVYAATLDVPRKSLPSLEVELILHAADGRLLLQVKDGKNEASTDGGAIANIPWTKDRLTPRAGDYSAAICVSPETETAPAGQGFLRMQISTLGKAIVRGELANGIKWTASTSLAADGRLPLAAKIPGARSLRGMLAFAADSTTSTALRGQLAWRSAMAEKCSAYGDSVTLSVAGDMAPATESSYDSFLAHRRHDLILSHPDLARFSNASGEVKVPFDTYEFQPRVALYYEDTNPLCLALRFDRGAKLATGNFTLISGGLKLSVALRGAPVTDSDSGKEYIVGYFLFPSADGKTQRSGDVTSVARPY